MIAGVIEDEDKTFVGAVPCPRAGEQFIANPQHHTVPIPVLVVELPLFAAAGGGFAVSRCFGSARIHQFGCADDRSRCRVAHLQHTIACDAMHDN